ncbi:YkgJ family cysteine cluster protein [Desulfonema ishimotonii]|uniref:YkgJ family cysteine cluster protein n=1 Tax=Desulfonema ishimotonii TaxID=45657 RepID=A0A401G1Y1_9BACT|nr:YkgJ family cysteine cluster protein [Desulfonema ishimotonii]GBC63217.1 YkgJ family cysteine cluster protein [Desulfonema ishimotonii]
MNFKEKQAQLNAIYAGFEAAAREFKKEAVCRPGCAFCCTDVGSVDITTLEGLVIRDWLTGLSGKQKARMNKRLLRNRQAREAQRVAECPFIAADHTCRIYAIRPFSCRQLYSLKKCGAQGPTVHRQAVALAAETVKTLQRLDDTGYSGHMSVILHLLGQTDFRTLYRSGGFDPPQIMDFGKKHGILINRFAAEKERTTDGPSLTSLESLPV